MLKVVMLIVFSVNLLSGGVDIIIDTFSSLKDAQNAKEELKSFIQKNKIPTSSITIEEVDNIFYIKVGTFNQNIRDDENVLATFALKYPNIMLIPNPPFKNKTTSKSNLTNFKKDFIKKNSSTFQWILLVFMALGAGVVFFLRFKMVKRVKQEQNLIKKEQKEIENNLNQTEGIKNGN